MQYRLLREILELEGTSFQQIERRWRPTDLLYMQQVRALLFDMRDRYDRMSKAEMELRTLDRADLYIRAIRRMRLFARTASYTWKADQLMFLRAVAGYYDSYGAILRLLKIDQARGQLADGIT